MKLKIYYILSILVLLNSGCFKEDEPVPPYQSPEGVTTVVAEMGPTYATHLFYDFSTNQFIKVSNRNDWDLAFQAGNNDYHIFINHSKLMKIIETNSTDFDAVTAVTGTDWRYDNSNGHEDSTAIGEWGQVIAGGNVISNNKVYIIDRGLTETGVDIGRKKVQFLGLTENVYTVKFANLDGSQANTVQITKDDTYNFNFLSLTNGAQPIIEPPKVDWDLVFTQYTALVYADDSSFKEQYSVNGALLNPFNVRGAREFSRPFEDIKFTDIASYNFTEVRDIIGYDWKIYDFDLLTYLVVPTHVYLVKDVEGNYYKMRFIGFINDQGQRGYPKFEIARF